MNFDLDSKQRAALFDKVIKRIENFYEHTKDLPISPNLDAHEIRTYIDQTDFNTGGKFEESIDQVMEGLEKYTVHTPHPKYFGLFNPRSSFGSMLADLITAAYNPQMAAWSQAPYSAEVEQKVIQALAMKFGYAPENADGVFASGGAEANLTALLCALNQKYPNFAEEGIFGIKERPIIFCSEEAHHSVQKAAKCVGLGYKSVQTIEVSDDLKINITALENELLNAKNTNTAPLMIIGTAGTTGLGAIDDLRRLSELSEKYDTWFHVDAAYGGAAILSENLKLLLKGIEASDSITFDAHKWMSVPMGASVFLTSRTNILEKTFRITTEYMPKEAAKMKIIDQYTHSIQWSRRFIGLKVYLSLLFYGWKGYEKVIDHQTEMGELLKQKLIESEWSIKNDTKLPIVCFTDTRFENDPNFTKTILAKIMANRKSWLSIYPVKNIPTLRACITNYATTATEIEELVEELNQERALLID